MCQSFRVFDRRESERFFGRDADISRLESLLEPDHPARVFFINGPGAFAVLVAMRR